jgi:hypothetical protein
MATPQLSPGLLVREVDLTVGRVDNTLGNIGAIAGPFPIGPVNQPINIVSEQQLINVFGKPQVKDSQYEYWMSASTFLSYGGVLRVVRSDGTYLNNANSNRAGVSTTVKIKNFDDYSLNGYSDDTVTWSFAAKNPGTWSNNLKVCMIDDKADQILGISTTNLGGLGINIGMGVTTSLTGMTIPGTGSTATFSGYLKGIITGINTDATNGNSTIDVKVISRVSSATTQYNNTLVTTASATAGIGTNIVYVNSVAGLNTSDTLSAPGLNNLQIVSVGATSVSLASTIASAINSGVAVTFSRLVTIGGTETFINYAPKSSYASFDSADTVNVINSSGANVATVSVQSEKDWYDEQTLNLTNSTIYWKSLAPKPISSNYSLTRNGKNDSLHVVVIDDTGSVTGIEGNLLEKHLFLSKATDAISAENSPTKVFWKDYLALNSAYVYAGDNPSDGSNGFVAASGFSSGFVGVSTGAGTWNTKAQGVTFNVIGNESYTLTGGLDYAANGGMATDLGSITESYRLFENEDELPVNYLIMGPGGSTLEESQAKANYLISLAEERKDCLATISPHKDGVVGETNTETQTNNIISFFSPLKSSSYAVFDSGYKYTYDRFNNRFVYLPCNADVAGLMARTDNTSFPWFSPAGVQRGVLNNAIKLAYNPNKSQRDALYPQRVNPIVSQPGVGILLFGDKTALSYASAFDRINVRKLFLTVQRSIRTAANAQLFEINDSLTRSTFINIVEPYLRTVQSQRGIFDFIVVCDDTNNTPDVIDNNEFRAEIYIKPNKVINYVTLTFVATRTGVSFGEVAGRV